MAFFKWFILAAVVVVAAAEYGYSGYGHGSSGSSGHGSSSYGHGSSGSSGYGAFENGHGSSQYGHAHTAVVDPSTYVFSNSAPGYSAPSYLVQSTKGK